MIIVLRISVIFLALVSAGCASLLNGSTQDVPIKIPVGTVVTDPYGVQLLVIRQAVHGDSSSYLKLHRSKKYRLQFDYNGQKAETTFSSFIEPVWIPIGIFPYIVPVIVDFANQTMNSFDGVAVHFSNDTSDSERRSQTYIEPYNGPPIIESNAGITLMLAAGHCYPTPDWNFLLPYSNDLGFEVGYKIMPKLLLSLSYHFTSDADLTPTTSLYHYKYSDLSTFQVDGRYDLIGGLRGGLGVGVALSRIRGLSYDSSDFRIALPNSSRIIPMVSPSLGYFGTVSFIEARYSFGLTDLVLENGGRRTFGMVSLHYGFYFQL